MLIVPIKLFYGNYMWKKGKALISCSSYLILFHYMSNLRYWKMSLPTAQGLQLDNL